jgi:HPt (histidine-containing phosphotransfer) domain-containing protein
VTDVADALEQLRERFQRRAAVDLETLRRWAGDPRANGEDLHQLVHRLAGAAGTFGFHRLSELAAKAEDAIVTEGDDLSSAIAALIEELQRVGG